MFSEKRGIAIFYFYRVQLSNLDLINIISSTYLDSQSNESSRQNLAEKPANFASCRLLYTTLTDDTRIDDKEGWWCSSCIGTLVTFYGWALLSEQYISIIHKRKKTNSVCTVTMGLTKVIHIFAWENWKSTFLTKKENKESSAVNWTSLVIAIIH